MSVRLPGMDDVISTRAAQPLAEGRQFWIQERVHAGAALEQVARDLHALAAVLHEIHRAIRGRQIENGRSTPDRADR